MSNTLIFGPILAMVSLTFMVLLLIPFMRITAVKNGNVKIKEYRYGDTDSVPERARLLNRNYINLLEIPVLFYLVCICYFLINQVNEVVLYLAWSYVAFRVIHSYIHILYNNVQHRFAAFALSNVVLIILWVNFAAFYISA